MLFKRQKAYQSIDVGGGGNATGMLDFHGYRIRIYMPESEKAVVQRKWNGDSKKFLTAMPGQPRYVGRPKKN